MKKWIKIHQTFLSSRRSPLGYAEYENSFGSFHTFHGSFLCVRKCQIQEILKGNTENTKSRSEQTSRHEINLVLRAKKNNENTVIKRDFILYVISYFSKLNLLYAFCLVSFYFAPWSYFTHL